MRRISIRLRLMALMILLATLPVVIMTWIAAGNTRASVESEMIDANLSRIVWADQYLTELIRQIDTLFVTLQINQPLMDSMVRLDDPQVGVQYQTHNDIRNILTSTFHVYSRKIDELTLYAHNTRKAFTVDFPGNRVEDLEIQGGNWSRMLIKPVHMYFKRSGDDIYAYHSINQFEDRAFLGGIAARIDENVWDELGAHLLSEEDSSYFLLNDEGELLAGSAPEPISDELRALIGRLTGNGAPEPEYRRLKHDLVFIKSVGAGKLTIVKAIPLETINRSSQATVRAGILTGALFAATSILLSILFSLRITRPIVNLARSMKSATLRHFEEKTVHSLDEIGLLERGYNSMMRRIKELIDVEYRNEIELKNAHLKALQAQINPHFLNNTLHLIGGMALAKGAPDIYRITRVVGDLLRYSIGSGDDVVTLADELEHMRNYLFIQEQRFAGRCSVSVAVDESLLAARIPKFTLQPVVENAFEHGLQRQEGAWRVDVRVKRIGHRIAILIRDNGVGMTERSLRDVREALRTAATERTVEFTADAPSAHAAPAVPGVPSNPPESPAAAEPAAPAFPARPKGIGLSNVNARLKLHFGRAYGVRLFSKPAGGTLVVLIIPQTFQEVGPCTTS